MAHRTARPWDMNGGNGAPFQPMHGGVGGAAFGGYDDYNSYRAGPPMQQAPYAGFQPQTMPYQPQRPNELNGFAPHYAPTMPGGAPMPNGLKMMNVAGSASQHAFAPPPMFGAQQAPMPPPFDHGPPHDLGPPHRRGHQQQLDGFNGRFMQPQQQADGGLPQSPMQFMPPSSMRPPMQMNNNGGGNFDIGVFQTPASHQAPTSLGGCWEDPNAERRKYERWTGLAYWGDYEKRQNEKISRWTDADQVKIDESRADSDVGALDGDAGLAPSAHIAQDANGGSNANGGHDLGWGEPEPYNKASRLDKIWTTGYGGGGGPMQQGGGGDSMMSQISPTEMQASRMMNNKMMPPPPPMMGGGHDAWAKPTLDYNRKRNGYPRQLDERSMAYSSWDDGAQGQMPSTMPPSLVSMQQQPRAPHLHHEEPEHWSTIVTNVEHILSDDPQLNVSHQNTRD